MRTVMKLAGKIFLLQLLLGFPYYLIAHPPGDARPSRTSGDDEDTAPGAEVLMVANSPTLPEGLLPVLGESEARPEMEKRVASSLQKLGKTLILERTRGDKEVALYRAASPAVILVVTEEGLGSGTIIDRDGHVITNWHVTRNQPKVVVVFKPNDGTELTKELAYWATVEKVDQVTDLALLKIHNPPKKFAILSLGDSSKLAVGQDVHAIGHPEGEVWTYTKGIISQIRPNYKWSVGEGIVHQARVIQTQTPINPGNSGGPLLDDSARLVGVNSFRSTGEGLNYAVAVDVVQAFLTRPGSQQVPATHRTGVASGKPKCPETYDTKGQGWTNIAGCYYTTSAPPPDFWLVLLGPKGPLAYLASGLRTKGQIDKVVFGKDPQWESLEHYIDVDCNGSVDLIGHQSAGSEGIDSYRVPAKPLRLVTLANELDSALKRGKIPHSKLRVCQ